MSLPKPYYEDEARGIVIYNADCREVIPHLPKVDLLLTDPPYGIFKPQNGGGIMFGKETIYSKDASAQVWDLSPSSETLLLAIGQATEWVVWGGNYLADKLGACKGPLIWDKKTGDNPYADAEIAWGTASGTARIFHHQWCGAFKDSERNQKAIHPTQKPIALMKWCLGFFPKAETVLDPFMGSGTTLVACKQLGRKCIGIELEEKYCEIAARRLAQDNLFEPEELARLTT